MQVVFSRELHSLPIPCAIWYVTWLGDKCWPAVVFDTFQIALFAQLLVNQFLLHL